MKNICKKANCKRGLFLFLGLIILCIAAVLYTRKIHFASALPDVVMPGEIKTAQIEKNEFPAKDRDFAFWMEATGKYPTNTPFAKSAEAHVKKIVNSFIQDYTLEDIIQERGSSNMNADSVASVTFGKKLISYFYEDYWYTQGAHGNTVFSSETFDMTGKKYSLSDLFIPNSNYLQTIASLAAKYFDAHPNLEVDIADEIFASGLDPKEENFGTFAISGNTITFQFQQYQIAPYSSGAPTFEISVTDPALRDIIRPELFGL